MKISRQINYDERLFGYSWSCMNRDTMRSDFERNDLTIQSLIYQSCYRTSSLIVYVTEDILICMKDSYENPIVHDIFFILCRSLNFERNSYCHIFNIFRSVYTVDNQGEENFDSYKDRMWKRILKNITR